MLKFNGIEEIKEKKFEHIGIVLKKYDNNSEILGDLIGFIENKLKSEYITKELLEYKKDAKNILKQKQINNADFYWETTILIQSIEIILTEIAPKYIYFGVNGKGDYGFWLKWGYIKEDGKLEKYRKIYNN